MAKSAKKPTGNGAGGRPSSASARKSVAAARASSKNSNKIQIIIGSVAIVLMVVAVVVGVVMAKKNNQKPVEGYGSAKVATASLSDNGVLTVSSGSPKATVEVFADPLCTGCAGLEAQYGQQILKLADEGTVAFQYRFADFMNRYSTSGDYSTRVLGAIAAVTKIDGQKPGVVANYIATVFNTGVQPKARQSDHNNEKLAEYAKAVGASDEAVAAINGGKYLDEGKKIAAATQEAMAKSGVTGTPAVLQNGAKVDFSDTTWLTKIAAVAGSGTPSGSVPASAPVSPSGSDAVATSSG